MVVKLEDHRRGNIELILFAGVLVAGLTRFTTSACRHDIDSTVSLNRATISGRLEASLELFMVCLFMYNAILSAITFTFVNGERLSLHANSRVMERP